MINAFLSIIFGSIFITMFSFSIQLGNLNRTLLNIPLSIFEISVPLESNPPYFNKDILEENVKSYFASSLNYLNKNYDLIFSYFSKETQLICKSEYCDRVEINLKSSLLFYQYDKTMFYEIEVNNG